MSRVKLPRLFLLYARKGSAGQNIQPMRKNFLILVLAIISLVSCTKGDINNACSSDSKSPVFTATFENEVVKTQLDNNRQLVWTADDRLSIFTTTYNQQYVFTGETGSNSGDFEEVKVPGFHSGNALKTNYAVYPYSPDNRISNDEVISIKLPAVQSYAEKSFGIGANTMVAVTSSPDDYFLPFKNLCGFLVVKLYGTGSVRSISLKGKNGEKIAGSATITARYAEEPELEMASDATETITIDCGEDGVAVSSSAESPSEFWFCIPPTTFSQGFTVTVTGTDDTSIQKSVSSTKRIDRNVVISMSPFNVEFSTSLGKGVTLNPDVQYLSPSQASSYTTMVDENTFQVLVSAPEAVIPQAGEIVMCDYGNGKFFVGKVISSIQNGLYYTIETETPAINEVFSEINASAEINASNSIIESDFSEDDGIFSCNFVDESVWDDVDGIEVEHITKNLSVAPNTSLNAFPVNINLEYKIKNNIFSGSVFANYSGNIAFSGTQMVKMDITQRIGVRGSFSIAQYGNDRKYIPIFKPGKYIRIYSYGNIINISFQPEIDWFYSGKITLESELQLELDNTNYHLLKTEGSNPQCSMTSNKKQTYFRVKNLHTEAEVGLSVNCSVLASVINEKLLGAGLNIAGGVSIMGDKNVGLQYPGGIDFNMDAKFVPFLEASPFFAVRTTEGLKKFTAGTFSISLESFQVPLLPAINNLKGNYDGNKASVQGTLENENRSFIATKEDGIAIFEKGAGEPKERKQIIKTKSIYDEMEFDIDEGKTYEIAQYALDNNQYIYGERVPLTGCPDKSHPHAIDLGLSVKWACCNVGASRPEDYGGYYAWGETSEKSAYDDDTYKYWREGCYIGDDWYSSGYTKYVTVSGHGFGRFTDGKTVLDPEDDVAHVKWGGSWRMPTRAEFEELYNNCTSEWTEQNGVTGRRFTSKKNGNSIFLPASGFWDYGYFTGIGLYTSFRFVGHHGFYWSSSLNTDSNNHAWRLDFGSVDVGTSYYYGRFYGHSVRPVSE